MPFPQKHLPQVVIPENEYRALTYDTISAVAHKYNIAACALRRRLRDGSDNRVFVARRRPSEVFTEEELDMDWHTLYRLGKERHVLLESLQRLYMSRRLRARAQCYAAPAAATTTTTTTTTAAAATATPASSVGAAPQRRRQADAHATSAATARAGGSGGVATATVRWVAPLPGDGVADASLSQPPPSSLGASEHVAYDGNNSSNSNDNSNDAAAAARARNAAAAFADVMGVTARTRAWAVAYVCATTHTSLRRCASLHLLRTAQQERDDDEQQQQQRLQQQKASYDATSASTATDGDEGVTLPCALHAAWLRRLRPLPLSALQRCARHVMAARAVWEQQVVQPARARVAALHAHVAQQRRNALCYNVCLWQRRHPLRLVCDVLELYRTQWAADYAPACTRTADAGDACAHAATPPAVWLDELLEALTQLLCPALTRIPWLVRCDVLMTYPHMQLDEQLQLMRDTARSSALRSHDRDDNNNDNNNNNSNNNGNNDDNNNDDNDDDAHSRMPVTPQRLLRGYVDDDVVVPDRDVHTLTDNEYAALRRGFERHKRDGVRRLCNGTYGMTRN